MKLIFNLLNSYFAYIDSIGCTSCRLQLSKWEDFISYLDSISGEKFQFLLILQSQNKEPLNKIIKRDKFEFPVCIDTNGKFDSLNKLPKERGFHTFLLDDSNKIITIGNPIRNPKIKDLYLNKLLGRKAISPKQTIIEVDSTKFDWGIINKGEKKAQTITLRNVGKTTFYLKEITVSCDCIKASYNWDSISVNSASDIHISYTPEDSGEFIRDITIYGNIPNTSIDIEFKGISK